MHYELRLHRLIAALLTAILIGFVLLFVYLDHLSSNIWMEADIALLMEIAVSTGLGYIGMTEGVIAFEFGRPHKREILSYLALAALSIGCGLYLSLTEKSSLMTIALVVSPHAFLFGAAQLRASQHLRHHAAAQRALQIGGLCALLMSIGLVAVSRLSDVAAARFLAYVAAMTALQLIGFLMYKRSPSITPRSV